ncbi:retrovirus-related pol polyprotein from transposon TNT 1-94 [Tanacetum coccineum]
MRPFGCPVTILNSIYHLSKFDGKADEGFFVGYSTNIKAFRVFNSKTRIVEENLHVKFSEDTPNIAESGPNWLFDIDALTKSMNYELVVAGNQSNGSVDPSFSSSSKDSHDVGFKPLGEEEKKDAKDSENEDKNNAADENIVYGCDDDPNMPNLEEIVYSDDDGGVDAKADMTNLDTHIFVEPKKVIQALQDPSWIEAMQEELLQFKLQHGYTQEEGINYDEVFAPVARIEAIRLFLAYASFKDFVVYQMDVKSAFLYGKIEEEVYVYQPPGFEDLEFLNKVYKVEKALYGIHQAPRAWYETLSTYLLDNIFQRGPGSDKDFDYKWTQKDDGIFISQDKYVDEILKKFDFSTVKITSTLMETSKPLLKDVEAADVDVHLYRSMIGSLMCLIASRPDIMFAILEVSTNLAFGIPRISPLTLVANSTTEAEYVAAFSLMWLVDEIVIKEWEDRMERAATTTSSLEAEQDSDTILRGVKAQIRFEAASKQSNDPPLSRVNTLGSKEDIMKLKELIEFCTKLSERALDL